MSTRFFVVTAAVALSSVAPVRGQDVAAFEAKARDGAATVEQKVIEWRRDVRQHPEIGHPGHRAAKLVADHLRKLGLDVRTGVGGTGVVGILKGGKLGIRVPI